MKKKVKVTLSNGEKKVGTFDDLSSAEAWINLKDKYWKKSGTYEYVISDIVPSYIDLRRKEYGTVEQQLDEIFHDIDAWRLRIKGIKDKYPQPIEE